MPSQSNRFPLLFKNYPWSAFRLGHGGRALLFLIVGLIAFGQENRVFFPAAELEEVTVVKVFRDRVLFRAGEQEAIVKIGERLGREGWQMTSCHPSRIVLQLPDSRKVRIFAKGDDGLFKIQAYNPMTPNSGSLGER